MKTLAVLLTLFALPGCSTLATYTGTAAHVADGVVDAAEYTLCRAIPVGAWTRRYGNDPMRAAAWRIICADVAIETPAAPLTAVPAVN